MSTGEGLLAYAASSTYPSSSQALGCHDQLQILWGPDTEAGLAPLKKLRCRRGIEN